MSVLDHPLLTARYFFPRPDAPAAITWVDVEGARLACASRRSHGGPLLCHFHGNGETVADYVPALAEAFAARGVDTFFAEYRGYGASTGIPQLGAMLADVEAILEALAVPPARVVAYGRSIGSIYAIEAARRRPSLGGLVIESGIADPLERILFRASPAELGVSAAELRAAVKAELDHEATLRAFERPVLVLHAQHDRAVDPSHAERNAAWAPRSTLRLFATGDHSSILAFHMDAIVDEVARFAHAHTR